MTPGEIIKAAREAKGWTAYRLAQESGVSQSQISRAEAGKRALSLESARKICEAMGVSLAAFDHPA